MSQTNDEYPKLESTEHEGEHRIKLQRGPYLSTRFRLYDDELDAVIEHLESLK